MLLEMGIIAAGVPVGYALRKSSTAQSLVGLINTWAVRVLLFLLGLALGADSTLLAQIESLGLRAFCISTLSVMGSLIGAWIIRPYLKRAMEKYSPGGSSIAPASQSSDF